MGVLVFLMLGLIGAVILPWMLERLPIQLPQGDFWLAFGGAFITASVLLHLLPEFHFMVKVVPLIAGGFFLQFFVEMWTQGVEHGHAIEQVRISAPRLWSLWAALGIHSVMEGTALISAVTLRTDIATNMYLNVIIHKVPAAFILYFLFKESSFSKRLRFLLFGAFVVASPIGMLLGLALTDYVQVLWVIGAFVVGSFLHIGTNMLAEVGHHHQQGPVGIVAVILGIIVAWFT